MLRSWVTLLAACAGILASAADFALSLPPPQQQGVAGRRSLEEDRLALDATITFYTVACATGRLLYRLLGAHAEIEELRRWSRWYLPLINAVSGCWLIASGWPGPQQALPLRPCLAVGALLLTLAARDGWRGCQGFRCRPFA